MASHQLGHSANAAKRRSGTVLLQSVTLAYRTGGMLAAARKELAAGVAGDRRIFGHGSGTAMVRLGRISRPQAVAFHRDRLE